MQEIAYAKINLSLEVLGKRADGFHSVLTLLQLISLHDTLSFAPSGTLTLECDHPRLAGEGETNLVLAAARLLQDTTGTNGGAHITLQKNIPMSSGLGGGSSDAAAALRGLARLWNLDLRQDEMMYMAALLGSDVPFFLGGPTALGEGRGDIVTPISSMPAAWVVLLNPPYSVPHKTKCLYSALTPEDFTDGAITQRLVTGISRGKFPSPEELHNAFERAAHTIFTSLDTLVGAITADTGVPLHLSGSGPTLYSLFPEAREHDARKFYNSLRAAGLPTYLTTTVLD